MREITNILTKQAKIISKYRDTEISMCFHYCGLLCPRQRPVGFFIPQTITFYVFSLLCPTVPLWLVFF
jgi:hypothetical protein